MKKIVFLLIASLVLVSCGRDKDSEPFFPDSGNNQPENPYTPPATTPTTPVIPSTPTTKFAKLYFKNNSNINRYRCYVNNIAETTVPAKSTSKAFEYYSGTYQIVIEQVDNVYEDYKTTYSGNYNLTAGQTKTINFPNMATLTLKSNSVDDYNISINDGMFEYVCLTGNSITIKNLDCATYKVKFTQRNGYFFYPTVQTVYITLPENGKTYKFNP